MPNVLGYSHQQILEADRTIPENREARGNTDQQMGQLLQFEEQQGEDRRAAAENFAEENSFGFLHHAGNAFFQESALANGKAAFQSYATPFDVDYTADKVEADIKTHAGDLPPWAKDDLRGAKNPEHFQKLLSKVKEQTLYNQEGEYLGGTGMAAQMAGIMVNPETLLLGAAEMKLVSKFALTGAKKILTFGGISALSNMGQELAIMSNNKSRHEVGLIMAGAMGFGFGSVLGAITPNAKIKTDVDILKAVSRDIAGTIEADAEFAAREAATARIVKAAGAPNRAEAAFNAAEAAARAKRAAEATATETSAATTARATNPAEAAANAAEAAAQARRAAEAGAEGIEPGAKSVGAAAAIPPTAPSPIDKLAEAIPFLKKPVARIKALRPKWLQSMSTAGLNSENAIERQIYDALVENAAGTGGKKVATQSGYLKGELNTMRLRSVFNIERERGWQDWKRFLKKNGEWKSSRISRADFDDEVFEEITRRYHGQETPGDLHPAIKRVADKRIETEKLRFKMLQDSGVEGYQKLKFEDNLISHKWDSSKMYRTARMLRENGYDPKEFITNLLRKAILAGKEFEREGKYAGVKAAGKFDQKFMENTAKAQAAAIYDRFITRPLKSGSTTATLLTKADRSRLDEAVKVLAEKADDPAAYKSVMASLEPGDRRALDDTLSQIRLDANLEIDGFAARDLLDTTMGRNLDTKFRRDGGRAALAELGITSESVFLDLKQAVIAEELNLRGGGGIKDVNKFADQKANELIAMYRMILGENIEKDPGNVTARFARGLRQLATLSAMNQVGFAQAAEVGRLTSAVGVKSMLTNIFEFGKLRRDMISGRLKDPILRDFEAAAGVRLGDDHLLEHTTLRVDAGGHTLAHEDSPWFLKMVDGAMQRGMHVQGYINGMNMIMRYQHRVHAKGMMMRMFEDLRLKGLDKASASRLKRYADIGLGESDLKAMAQQMEQHATETTGWFGQRRLENLHLADWDLGIREKTILAMHKNRSQAIQRNLVGEVPLWMESSFGKLLTQFKTFPMVALEKQLIHDAKHFDPEAFLTTVFSLGMSSAMYMTATYANSFGLDRSKRRKFLKNRLSPMGIAQGAINWTGQAAIIPDAMNVAGGFFGIHPFQYTSTKGNGFRQAGDIHLGDVGAGPNYLNSAYRFATGLGHAALTGEQLTASTFRHGTRLIPFNNALGVRNLANALSNQFD